MRARLIIGLGVSCLAVFAAWPANAMIVTINDSVEGQISASYQLESGDDWFGPTIQPTGGEYIYFWFNAPAHVGNVLQGTVHVWEDETQQTLSDLFKIDYRPNFVPGSLGFASFDYDSDPLTNDYDYGISLGGVTELPFQTVFDSNNVSGWAGSHLEVQVVNDVEVPTVPEPSTLIIWSLLGGFGIAIAHWRKRAA
jgi:hypothetical protein